MEVIMSITLTDTQSHVGVASTSLWSSLSFPFDDGKLREVFAKHHLFPNDIKLCVACILLAVSFCSQDGRKLIPAT